MQRCLQLAKRGVTTPNPRVGSVVLDKNGRKVGEGFHALAGQPHAEVMALQQAGELARGGTLYVNLEPCNHTGRTPPCTKAIKAAGIDTVICGMLDPNPLVAGRGRNALQNARITVRHGILEADCRAINAPFIHFMETKKPFVTLKVATSLDGKLGPRSAKRHWLTGPLTQQYVHQLRHHIDGVLSTATTILADNARLTVRHIAGGPQRQPIRIILDRQDRLSKHPELALWQDDNPVWRIVSHRHQPLPNIDNDDTSDNDSDTPAMPDTNTTTLPPRPDDKILYATDTGTGLDLNDVMTQLGKAGISTLMVEAGGILASNLLQKQRIHQLVLCVAPVIIGDNAAPGLGSGLTGLTEEAPALTGFNTISQQQLDKDTIWTLRPTE